MKADLKLAGVIGAGLLLPVFLCLILVEPIALAVQWLLQAGTLWFWVLRATWQRSELNRPYKGAPLLANLGWANRVTLLRGYLIALTGGFLFQPHPEGYIGWLPGLLYGVAAILDRLDGFIARKRRETTLLGAELDTVFDALGLIVVPLLAIAYGKVHWSYFALSMAFYIFQWGLNRRRRKGLPVFDILPSHLRRAMAGFQMGFISAALLPIFQPSQTLICSFAFMLPVLLGFGVDWLVASGRIDGRGIPAQDYFSHLQKLAAFVLQPALRVLVASGLFFMFADLIPSISIASAFYLSGLVFGVVLVLAGWSGRLGALIILVLLASYPIPINFLSIFILCCSVWLLLLGTGRFSLWQWDDAWVKRQDGA